jgi:phenylacetate-CoA ligase
VACTREDLASWSEVLERGLAACGLRRGDRVLNAHAHGLDAVALGTHFRGEGLGVAVIPSCGGGTDRHVALLQDLGVAAVACTPGHFLHLVERGRELGADFPRLRVALLGGEPWSEALRRRIEADTRVRAYDLHGVPEVGGPGVAVECAARSGLHLLEDHWYPEVVDPDTGAVLPDGVEGELVLTTLTRRALPLLRFRTRDLTAFIPEPCACGRSLRRVRRVRRRCDDVLVVRGVSVYPGQVETALLAVEGTLPHYQIVLRGAAGLDELEVRVEVTPAVFSDQVRALSALREKLESALGHTLGLRVRATLVGPGALQRSAEPARRVVDERNP